MSTLTPEIARDLMWRSMTTGAPTSEFNKYGGYDAVRSVYDQSGGTYSLADIPAERKQQLAQTIANTGVGELSLLKETNIPLTAAGREAMARNGVTSFGADQLTELGIPFQQTPGEQLSALQSQYGTLQQQLADLQAQYNALSKTGGGSTTGSTVGSGGVVDDGSSFNNGGVGMGTGGVVYGPDGTAYSSAAAAIAAGVTNFTYIKPVIPQTPPGPGLIQGADNLTSVPPGVTGNVNPGGLIAGQNNQLFNVGPARVALPGGVRNPFAV